MPEAGRHSLCHAQLPSPTNASDSEDLDEPICIPRLSLSPYGTIDAGLSCEGNEEGGNACPGPLCHWHLAGAGAHEPELQPIVTSGKFSLAMDLASLAWHPRTQAFIYAIMIWGEMCILLMPRRTVW